jgi:hypothetical protein
MGNWQVLTPEEYFQAPLLQAKSQYVWLVKASAANATGKLITTPWRRVGEWSNVQLHAFLSQGRRMWLIPRPDRLTVDESARVPTRQKSGWVPQPIWTFWRKKSAYPETQARPSGPQTGHCTDLQY